MEKAFQPFRNFISNEEPSVGDEIAVELLQNLFHSSEEMQILINISTYRR